MTTAPESAAVAAQADNQPMMAHYTCPECYPEIPVPFGSKALCGEGLLGLPAHPDDVDCTVCRSIILKSFNSGTVFPCGHFPRAWVCQNG